MKYVLMIVCSLFICAVSLAQRDSVSLVKDIKKFQDELNSSYKEPSSSPLPAEKRKTFKGLRFFPVNLKYVVTANFTRTPGGKVLQVPTSGAEIQEFTKYGTARFTLLGKEYTLSIYQSPSLLKTTDYKNYLAIFFKDQTSGKETYGGGRYIDLSIPQGNTIIINFNKAYHPYCAYAEGFNCPIPPKENYLPMRIEAGVRL